MTHLSGKIISYILITPIVLYRILVSPVIHALAGPGMGCRFVPSCSDYAIEAIRLHGPFTGTKLAVKRILRCHPWGGCGYDPVPEPRHKSS